MDGDEGAPVGPGPEEEGSASGSGGSAGVEGCGGQAEGVDDASARIQPNKHRSIQMARSGGRKLFNAKAREEFLNWYAATGNVVWSAEKTGFDDGTIWRHRMNDPRFAEAFDRAFEQSVVRNKAKMLERKMKEKPIAIDGGVSEAELGDCDLDKAWPLIVEIERAKGRGGGAPVGRPPKAGRAPRVASNAEVRNEVEKRLRAFGRRMRAEGKAPPAWLPPVEARKSAKSSPRAAPATPPPPYGPTVAAQPGLPSGSPPDCRSAAPPSPSGDGEDQG